MGEKGRENRNHKNLSPLRDIRKIGRYIPRCWSVVGVQRGEGNLSLPTTKKTQNLKRSLELVRYKFFQEFLTKFGWVRLPVNWSRIVSSDGRLRKGVIRKLTKSVFLTGQVVGGGGSVGGIDLIPADNSPKVEASRLEGSPRDKNPTLRELIREYLTLKGKEEKTKEDLKRLREIEGLHKKFARVYNRLRNLPRCSTTGHMGVKGTIEDYELVYHPHRCHSLVCPVCGFYESREKFRKVFDLLKLWVDLEDSKLAFITLTGRPFENPTDAVGYMFKIRQKIYNLNLSERLLERLRPILFRELLGFYRSLKRRKGIEYAGKRIKEEIRHIREFVKEITQRVEEKRKETKKVRLGDIYSFIWKFEIHKTEKGWHPHWHVISSEFFPKTLLNAFWRYITEGRGEITDIRRLRGRKAIAEISKYETKPVNSKLGDLSSIWSEGKVKQSNGVEVTLEELFELELALYGRQKITVWGEWKKPAMEGGEEVSEGEEKTVHLWCVDVKTKTPMFHIPKAIRLARKIGRKVYITKCEIRFSPVLEGEKDAQLTFKGYVYARGDGDLGIEVKFSNKEEKEWFEELLERAMEYCLRRTKKVKESIEYNPIEEKEPLPDFLRERIEIENLLGF